MKKSNKCYVYCLLTAVLILPPSSKLLQKVRISVMVTLNQIHRETNRNLFLFFDLKTGFKLLNEL